MKNVISLIGIIILSLFIVSCNKTKKEKENCCPKAVAEVVSVTNYPEWSQDAVIYEVNLRQYTPEGTIAAFEKHLPRLQELGVEILWFMPVHPISEKNRKGSLGSYYAVQDYKKINPEFGTMDDFKAMVAKCHEMGFKVILDWVANHTGWDNIWMTQNPEWYTVDSTNTIIPPVPDWSDVADLNYDNKEMRAAMIDALSFWVKEADIDGYRCDVAGMVPVDFWEEARATLDKIKPVYMLAEDQDTEELLVKAFNSNYGWSFHSVMNKIAKGEGGIELVKNYFSYIDSVYPAGSYPMQFTSNHDENSWNGTEYERMGEAAKTFAALSFMVPGMPLIYTGQETANSKRLKFFDKDQVEWGNAVMQDFYEKLIDIKQANKALWNGNTGAPAHFLHTTEDNSMLVMDRAVEGNQVVSIFNLSDKPVINSVGCPRIAGSYTNAITGEEITCEQGETFNLKPWEYIILIAK